MDYFRNSYQYDWSNTEDIAQLKMYQDASKPYTISFSTPVLNCYGNQGSGKSKLFEMNVTTKIFRTETIKVSQQDSGMYHYKDAEGAKRALVKTYQSGPTSIPDASNDVYCSSSGNVFLRKIRDDAQTKPWIKAGSWSDYYTLTNVLATANLTENSKYIEFTIDSLTLEEIDKGKGYRYEIECVANPTNPNAMLQLYEATHVGSHWFIDTVINTRMNKWEITTSKESTIDPSSCKITSTIYYQDMTKTSAGGAFIRKGVKYSAYELLRKALLTTDTYLLENGKVSLDEYNNNDPLKSIDYPILLDTDWNNRLKTAKIHETIFEGKNLWEVLLQIGYYIHAIPYFEYAKDGTDRFVLTFRQLGGTKENKSKSTKLTVFNSQNLSDYFTQFDSYVTNLFSPQNIVEEWLVPKTVGNNYLVSNNTALLQLTKPITELLEFDITMKVNGTEETRSALEYVFEKSIYEILSNDNPYKVFPCKGTSLYFSLGDNIIEGLSFVPPSASEGSLPMALKRILQLLWQGTAIEESNNIKFNTLKFHIKYRTQDTARINQFRPDLEKYLKNSKYEKFPHHEQFFGQQDKIIDSERFSANLFGKLIRVGNSIYQCQELVTSAEKEAGDLVEINGDKYYVKSVENEYYADAIFQKVTYSKNFNQLSMVVSIPSEPRFYEVSERSKIRREVRVMDFFTMATYKQENLGKPRFLNNDKWKEFFKQLVFNTKELALPNYAWTRFIVDKLRKHNYDNNKMFPSSLLERSNQEICPKDPSDHTDVIVPLLHFPLHDGIMFTWDMADNFKAADFVDETVYNANITNDDAYLSMQPMRYVDIYGRADLFNFKLFNKTSWTFSEAQKLPQAVVTPTDNDSIAAVWGQDMAVGLDKDGREEISFNYQINMLHKSQDGDEEFITFPNLYGKKNYKGKLKICLLNGPQSLFNENQNLKSEDILADSENGELDYALLDDSDNAIEIKITLNKDLDLSTVKSIVLYEGTVQDGKCAYIAKNVQKLPDEHKLDSWWIYPVFNDVK